MTLAAFTGAVLGGTLLAVLLNPPQGTTGTRTRNAVVRAGRVLGYDEVEIVNLCSKATRSVVELNHDLGEHRWADAREDLSVALQRASGLLGAWGVSGMTGLARRARDEQVEWLCAGAACAGMSSIWMVGGRPRHPSRWHQYVADKYGRTAGGTFDDRLKSALVAVGVHQLASSEDPDPNSRVPQVMARELSRTVSPEAVGPTISPSEGAKHSNSPA